MTAEICSEIAIFYRIQESFSTTLHVAGTPKRISKAGALNILLYIGRLLVTAMFAQVLCNLVFPVNGGPS